MTIRVAEGKDAEQLSILVRSLISVFQKDKSIPLSDAFMETIKPEAFLKRIGSDDYFNLVYAEGDIVKGYLTLHGGSHLYHLFVREDCHHAGIGRQLWQHAIALFPEVKLFTVRASLNAVPFYQKLGFFTVSGEGFKDGIAFQFMDYIRS